MDLAREKRVIRLFEQALDWPPAAREARLREVLADEPDVLASVLAMLKADDASAMLPTLPPEPASLDDLDHVMPERIGNYRIVEEIGRGGMGLVYRAARNDGLFDQQVAIKVIRRNIFSATTDEQFATERRILARLHHPHIAHLLDGGVSEDGAPYIIMELIKGVPITEHAASQGLDLAARLALFRDACEALEYAHRELVVHADVKPSNVVVAEGFGVKLLDFGIARLVGGRQQGRLCAHPRLFRSGAAFGRTIYAN
ncbi:MAG: serine/threonine protein kinase [Sphingomonadales bacterium]|nr:serine/threonine protein kinase [Sphingomonadales bacterium]